MYEVYFKPKGERIWICWQTERRKERAEQAAKECKKLYKGSPVQVRRTTYEVIKTI